MNTHKKKMIAPVVISIIFIVYYIVYFGFIVSLVDGMLKVVFGIIPAVFSAVMLKVCYDRIKEIKKGEEDDIGKY